MVVLPTGKASEPEHRLSILNSPWLLLQEHFHGKPKPFPKTSLRSVCHKSSAHKQKESLAAKLKFIKIGMTGIMKFTFASVFLYTQNDARYHS